MERSGIEIRGVHEMPRFLWIGAAADFIFVQIRMHPTGDSDDEYRSGTVGLASGPFHPSIRFMYQQKLSAEQSRTPPMIRAKIGDTVVDLRL
jgi:hypothetical protein